MNPALFFSPDGYDLNGPRLMGRQAAGNGFLRAAVKGRDEGPLFAYAPERASGEAFASMVAGIDPTAETRWIQANRLDQVAERGLLFRPDQVLAPAARLRLRAGPAAYSLCGLTHTIATTAAMGATVELLTAPLMAWDALICTSSVAAESLGVMIAAQQDYLRWRFGQPVAPPMPQLPVIPLGVHCDDFEFSDEDRAAARRELGIDEDEVVALFAGRLTFNAKAHPHAMYAALQQVAEQTGRRIVLIQAGQFPNAPIEAVYRSAAAQFCPAVRALFVDGKDQRLYRASWRAGDFFVSLSDNIQETFGLTPVEAMAAGMPVLVSDWNGYKDTVRDGIDGFRVKTWSPAAPVGAAMACDYEAEVSSYDLYLSRTSTTVSMVWRELVERTTVLVTTPDVRRAMGASARDRARRTFDWSVVYGRYKDLWAELGAVRQAAQQDPPTRAWLDAAPKVAPNSLDPYEAFASYPTMTISLETVVSLSPQASVDLYRTLTDHTIMSFWKAPTDYLERLFGLLSAPRSVRSLAAETRSRPAALMELIGRLAKLGLVVLHAPAEV